MTKRSLPKYLLNYISKFKKKKKNTFKLQTNSTKTTTCNTIHDNNCNDHDLFSKTPKFEDIIPSDRFFTSPATAGSLAEDARLSFTSEMNCSGVAVVVYTCDPSCEFRQSMQEMVSSRRSSALGVHAGAFALLLATQWSKCSQVCTQSVCWTHFLSHARRWVRVTSFSGWSCVWECCAWAQKTEAGGVRQDCEEKLGVHWTWRGWAE